MSNISNSFSPEKGFFRAVDDKSGGGGPAGGGGKDDENMGGEKKDKEPLDVLSQLRNNLKEIESLIRNYDPLGATDVLKRSRELIKSYQPSSDAEKAALLFFTNRLKLKAEALHFDEDGEVIPLPTAKVKHAGADRLKPTNDDNKDADGEKKQAQESCGSGGDVPPDGGGPPDDGGPDKKPIGEEFNRLLSRFDSELSGLEAQSFVFAEDKDWVDEAFETIKGYLARLKESSSTSEEVLRIKEIKMWQLEYKKRREAMFKTLEEMEKTEFLTEGFFARALEGPGLNRMNNIVVRLGQLGDEKNTIYVEDLKKVDKHYKSRKWLLITWLYVSPKLFEGSGQEGERSSFGQVGDNQFPIKGKDFQELVLGGLDFDSEFGGILNQRLGVKSVSVEKFGERLAEGENPRKERKEIEVTLFTFCMREFDRIYKNGTEGTGDKDPDGNSIPRVTTQNLRENKGVLVDYVCKKAKKYAKEHGQPEIQIDEHAVDLAFRTHLLLTMHHCRYAEGSPSLKDDWYYVFNWPSYVLSYRKKGVDKFDWRATFLQFGISPGFQEDGVSDKNILAKMFDASKVRDVERKLEKRGMLDESVRGLRSLRGLVNGYSILLEDVSPSISESKFREEFEEEIRINFNNKFPKETPEQIQRRVNAEIERKINQPDYSFLAPPLRYLMQKDKGGKFVTFSSPEGTKGLPIFLDEITDEKGSLLYELFNYDGFGSELMEYYNCMNQHGINSFLNQFVKAERFEFMENATNPKVLKNWKNEARYAAPLLPRVGRFVRMRMDDFGDPVKMNPERYSTEEARKTAKKTGVDEAVMDRILYQIIFINCILRTSYTLEKKYSWSDMELKSYLLNLSSEKILSPEEADAIFAAVITYRGQVKMFTKGLLDETIEQVTKRNIFK
jgi:hypothetical protein